ncbi:hypothetical protein GIB67_032431 [Kingdonia uniflora]|uniref:AAA+ ATPase domain-containing protein n=1 Tax=Kingdonia uniflora TaxID=39325 RepID=A0A7J7MIT3_9MAGN|nr:hypothetical protein GIB67_032431 [Kingdonia uniflora]
MSKRSSSNFDRTLFRRLSSIKTLKNASEDEIIDHLRSNYPDYSRIKLQPFSRNVKRTLQINKNKKKLSISNGNNNRDDFDEYDSDVIPFMSSSTARKKSKKNDEREERLARAEADHLRRQQRDKIMPNESSQEGDTEEEEEESDSVSVSTSVDCDAIYEKILEPIKFDVTKLGVTEVYMKQAEEMRLKKEREKNVEMEIVSSKKVVRDSMSEGVGVGGVGGDKEDGPWFKDIGGMDTTLEELKVEVLFPFYHPEVPKKLGVRPLSGILLHGLPGCGKTMLAHAIANETGAPFYKISATEIVSNTSGDSEDNIRKLFSNAHKNAPSIIFIDEIDAIAPKRENLQREMEKRIVTQLLTCMDESHQSAGSTYDVESDSIKSVERCGHVLVIGATNRLAAIDSALRRPGRFDREIVLGVPDENARTAILSLLTRGVTLEGAFDLAKIARSTPGFVGADLAALVNKAGNCAMKRNIDRKRSELSIESNDGEKTDEWWKQSWSPEEMESLNITMADFEEASKMVQPSTRREGFSTIPNVKWEDVGGLVSLRTEFQLHIVLRIKHPELYKNMNLDTGFLLYGPPGCGKTLIAKAVANEAGANFIHIKGPELLTKYVGESELAVRTIFNKARTCAPCIIFFDEVDALTTKRGKEGGWVVERLLNQLLIELDGADSRRGVYVIGATNRREVMDPAILRPGRLGKLLKISLPGPDDRHSILKTLARGKPIDNDDDLLTIAHKKECENLSGADLAALMDGASMVALEENIYEPSTDALEEKIISDLASLHKNPWTIKLAHFEKALEKVLPSVSRQEREYYEDKSMSFDASRI